MTITRQAVHDAKPWILHPYWMLLTSSSGGHRLIGYLAIEIPL